MLTIRGFVLDSVALIGVGVGLFAGIGGYLSNLPDPPERVALAAAAAVEWPDPETTGAITPKDTTAADRRQDGERADDAATKRFRPADETRVWTDPPRRSVRARSE